jgi:hypothetical protein
MRYCENHEDNQRFFTVFPDIMFLSELRVKYSESNILFLSILISFKLIYYIKNSPHRYKIVSREFSNFKLVSEQTEENSRLLVLMVGASVHGFLKFLNERNKYF